jgi:hypothetical protein
MAHSGFSQYIGVCAHYWEIQTDPKETDRCPVCGAAPQLHAYVFTTNGYGIEYGHDAVRAPYQVIGYSDTWHKDHYGNHYAVKHDVVSPVGDRWQLLNQN